MPLSFRRSYKKRPILDLESNKRQATQPEAAKTARASPEFRATKYPLGIPVGCGALIGLVVFGAFARGWRPSVWMPSRGDADVSTLATLAFETALASRLGTLEAGSAESTAMDTNAAIAVPSWTSTAPPMPAGGSTINPWAEAIPTAACIPSDLPQTGRVVEIVDGDTVKVLMDSDGRVYSVRYLGADAPDKGSAFGLQAMARNIELVYRRQAILVRDITDTDGSGTLLRYVLAEGVFINHEMVAGGLAQSSLTPPDTACLGALLTAQQQAQASGLGMWAQLTPVP